MGGDAAAAPLAPETVWAQNKSTVTVSFVVECAAPEVTIETKRLVFAGRSPDGRDYRAELPLYAEVDPARSKHRPCGRTVEVTLAKAKDQGWPSLAGDGVKRHWLKVDFAKTEYSDGDSDNENLPDFSTAMRNLGGLSDPGDRDKPSFDDVDTDSDDEELPDLI